MHTDHQEEYIPIRELSALTGVNSVTIRAWERRYGLLKPIRTPKGHRLYTANDVQTIQTVQRHLEHGIPVSKIKGLINNVTSVDTDESWKKHSENIIRALSVLDQNKLENIIHELTGSYPAHILWCHLIKPLDETLAAGRNEYGGNSKQLLWEETLSLKATAFIESHTSETTMTILLAGLDHTEASVEPRFIAMQMAEAGIKPLLAFYRSSLDEIPFIAEKIALDGIVLCGNGSLTKQLIAREIAGRLGKLNIPLWICGNAARINQEHFAEQKLECSTDHQIVIRALKKQVASHG